MTHGDPSWAGPLAGVAMGLPVFHILEPEIKAQIDPQMFDQHLELMDVALEVEKISNAIRRIREEK